MRGVQMTVPPAQGANNVAAVPEVGPVAPRAGSASAPAEWQKWFDGRRRQVDAAIAAHFGTLEKSGVSHSRLAAAVEYSMTQTGKRLRPILVLESCAACGGTDAAALPAALALECVHTFSLIHDDLPAMDDDDLRRGVPTNHKVFGEALAILAGDWLLAHAFALLGTDNSAAQQAALVQALAAGTAGMIGGQAADIAGEDLPTAADLVRYIHLHKTACLIEAACRLGALAAAAPARQVEQLAAFGRHLGLAFQITDDLLDQTGRTDVVGKRVGKDAAVSKQTYPAAFGVDESRRQAQREVDAALAELECFAARAEELRGLARFVLARDR
jgi:geranylgeranyl diphosphate synthase, type II